MDPYDDLGVARNADGKTIRRAYRKRVQKEHPDKGGNEEGFKRLQLAYDVLSDPARKDRYDRLGESGVDKTAQKALSEVATMFVQLVDQVDSDHTDLRAIIIQRIREGIAKYESSIGAYRSKISKLERAIKRVKKRSPGENLVAGFFAANIRDQNNSIVRAQAEIERGKMMLKIVEDYEYVVDARTASAGVFLQFSQAQNPNRW